MIILAGFGDGESRMRFALTVVGSAARISEDWGGPIAPATKAHAQQFSQRLGYRAG